MQMQPDFQLAVMIKSLRENIIPAIDSKNQLAQEQAQMVLGMLNIMENRLDLHYHYSCDELRRTIDLVSSMKNEIKGGSKTRSAMHQLTCDMENGSDVLNRARATPAEIVNAVQILREGLGNLIKEVFIDGENESEKKLRKKILANAKEQMLRERSWLIMQGLEIEPDKIPPIEELIKI